MVRWLLALLALAVAAPAQADEPQCSDALKASFKPDALTTVLLVKQFRKGDKLVLSEKPTTFTPTAANDLCLVKLVVGPGNPGPAGAPSTSPGIGIEVWLPPRDAWNQRIHNVGGLGGFDGGQHTSLAEVGWFVGGINAVAENAVVASSDMGHSGSGGSFGMNPDGSLASQLWTDYAHRAQHEMAVKTKALVLAYYGRPHKFAYYEGSSSGGRHGFSLAQRYPADYDGIIAHLPALYFMDFALIGAWKNLVVMRDLGGVPPSEAQQDLVSNAAIAACDVVGGQHLGYILDNAACRYDPRADKAVLCLADGGTNATKDCVNRKQATAILKWWYGPTSDGSVPDPAKDNGVAARLSGKHRWYGYMRGTSLYNVYFTKIFKMIKIPGVNLGSTLAPGELPSKAQLAASGGGFGGDALALLYGDPALAGENFKNALAKSEGRYLDWSYARFDKAFARAKQLDAALGGVSTTNPDISAFKASGGKLIATHGWNDEAIPIQGTIQYYDSVVRRMGQAQTDSFFKLYLSPGGGHESPQGTSNPNAHPPKIAGMYGRMVRWVEQGIEPGRIDMSTPYPSAVTETQPVCPHPQRAVWVSGDIRIAASYACR